MLTSKQTIEGFIQSSQEHKRKKQMDAAGQGCTELRGRYLTVCDIPVRCQPKYIPQPSLAGEGLALGGEPLGPGVHKEIRSCYSCLSREEF